MTAAPSLTDRLYAAFDGAPPARLGVALSGGGDSVALLHLLRRCLDPAEVTICAATVDHGLRAGSAAEAVQAGAMAADLGVDHDILNWTGWDRSGNLQDQARQARYGLLAGWAQDRDLAAVALGHTADDQAETVLMRLGRAAGVTGLAAMPRRRVLNGVTFIRPMLAIDRAELRTFLRAEGIRWIDDPSNEDSRFERIRLRKAMAQLAELGLTVPALTAVADNMSQADEALEVMTRQAAEGHVRQAAGALAVPRSHLAAQPTEIARRFLQLALRHVAGPGYPPRRAPLMALLEAALAGKGGTLAGCRVLNKAAEIWICREYNAVRDLSCPSGGLWDDHWQLIGDYPTEAHIRALGPEGLKACPDWRETGLPRQVLEASPAVWQGEVLFAAPAAGRPAGWHAKSARTDEDFPASVLSH